MKADKIKVLFLSLLTVLLPATNALALDRDYYTYGGFDIVVKAFNQCALIFSSGQYKGLVAVFFIASLALGLAKAGLYGLQTAVRDQSFATSKPSTIYGSIITALIGAALFIGLVSPKGTLHIYDTVDNQYQAVGGVPDLIVAIAGGTNLLERAIVGIIDTSGDPLNYSKQAGAKSIKILNQVTLSPIYSSDTYLDASMDRYISDCVMFEISNSPGSGILGDLKKSTSNYIDTFQKGQNPSNYTVLYDSANGQGVTDTCTNAFITLKNRWTAADYSASVVDACQDAGYKTDTVAGLNSCKSNTTALMSALATKIGTSASAITSLDSFIKQMYLSQRLRNVLVQDGGDPSLFADYNAAKTSNSAASTFERNAPIIRAGVLATAICFLPFVLLTIVTSFWSQALKFTLGVFAFCLAWNVSTALLHGQYIDYAITWWKQNLAGGIGLDPSLMFSSTAGKLMSYAAAQQAVALAIATTAASAFGFMGSSMGKMAGAGGTQAQQAATDHKSMTAAEDRGQTVSNMRSGQVQDMANHEFGSGMLAKQEFLTKQGQVGGTEQFQNATGLQGATANTVGAALRGTGTGMAAQDKGIQPFAKTEANQAAAMNQSNKLVQDSFGSTDAQAAHMSKSAVADASAYRNKDGSIDSAAMQRDANFLAQVGKGDVGGKEAAFAIAQQSMPGLTPEKWQSIQSELGGIKNFADAKEMNALAAKHGMTTDQLMGVMAASSAAAQGGKALAQGGGASRGFTAEQAQAIRSGLGDKALTDKQYEDLAKKNHIAGQNGMTAGQTLKAAHDGLLGDLAKPGANKDQVEKNWAASVQKGMWMQRDVAAAASDAAGMVAQQGAVKEMSQAEQERAANAAQLLQQHPELASNRDYVNPDGTLTQTGMQLMERGRAGGKINDFVDQNGTKHSAMLDGQGRITQTAAAGIINKGETGRLNDLKSDLRGAGFGEAAKRLDQLKDHGFGFRVTRGSDGQIATFEIGSGGNAKYTDRWDKNTGSTQTYTNNSLSDTSRKNYHQTEEVGGNKRNVENTNITGSTTKSGDHVDIVKNDGTRVKGVVDRHGNLSDGTESKIVSRSQVENIGPTLAVVTRVGDGMTGSVAVTADGSKKTDISQEQVQGTAVTDRSNAAGAMLNKEFREGDALAASDAAAGSATVGAAADGALKVVGRAVQVRTQATELGGMSNAEQGTGLKTDVGLGALWNRMRGGTGYKPPADAKSGPPKPPSLP